MKIRRVLPLLAVLLASAPKAGFPGEAAVLQGAVIGSDTSWSGTVTVRGPAIVKKGATLTIHPGTAVRFEWVDEDENGIGDGELNVEGRLVAVGTNERPIRFTSAKERPGKKDWTYVMISLSRESRVEHCIFEYAFTGLQVHLSTAVIRHSVFRRNFEALRFSTADILIEENVITGNTYGIRYESRDSATTITGNVISGNDYAFFPVVRCGPEVKITGNTIVSREYNVKMGQLQREDVDYTGNWWGSADEKVIEEGFFDHRRDRSLGRVIYRPFLSKPPGGGKESDGE
jgi:parallel beta-helix repeat protein